MKRITIVALTLSLLLALTSAPVLATKPADKGFDEFGYNYNARLFNDWDGYYDRDIEGGPIPGTNDAWLVMKWSKDWTPMEDQPVGAWVTNHFTWYSDDYDEGTWYGWDTREEWTDESAPPEASYRIEEFAKIMKVGDDEEEWTRYEEGGAFGVWGQYESGVPKYVVFQDVISVYQRSWNATGAWVISFEYEESYYDHDMILSQTGTSLTGTGGYPVGGSYEYPWTITSGSVGENTIDFEAVYDAGCPVEGATMVLTGTIAPDGTITSGTWSDNAWGQDRSGTWTSTSGQAMANYSDLIAEYNLCTAAPKGLGKPIF